MELFYALQRRGIHTQTRIFRQTQTSPHTSGHGTVFATARYALVCFDVFGFAVRQLAGLGRGSGSNRPSSFAEGNLP